ncbi:MAG: hypothetical protein HXY50_11475 [Ignavibacteriaceae bacterium]|nr:hypothetical protein [Ignavibacteriaceae bacterium]
MMKSIYILIGLLFSQFGCSGSKEAWDNARRTDTIYSYEQFLEEYPNSDFSNEARNILDKLYEKRAWDKARLGDNISSYEEFIILFPQSELKKTALERINEIKIDKFWEQTRKINTIDSYNDFLLLYPNSKYETIAKEKLNTLIEWKNWDEVLLKNSLKDFYNFISNYPQSKYVEIAKSKIKEIEEIKPLWEKVVKSNSVEKYREFLQKYPFSLYSDLAKSKIKEFEKLDWENAKNKNTISSYKSFIERHPTSYYREDAESKIVDLEVKKIFESEHGYLPPSTKTKTYTERRYSVMNIYNDTKYDMTLRYSGIESFKIIFKPKEKSAFEIVNGNYKVTASVNAINVIDYAGTEEIDGGDYSVTYYITHDISKNDDTKWHYVDESEVPSYPIKRRISSKFK